MLRLVRTEAEATSALRFPGQRDGTTQHHKPLVRSGRGPASVARQANRYDLSLPQNQRKLDLAEELASARKEAALIRIELPVAIVLSSFRTSCLFRPGQSPAPASGGGDEQVRGFRQQAPASRLRQPPRVIVAIASAQRSYGWAPSRKSSDASSATAGATSMSVGGGSAPGVERSASATGRDLARAAPRALDGSRLAIRHGGPSVEARGRIGVWVLRRR